ncbi:response regulator receiver protein [Mycolicibacterium gilvum]|uniref:Response regulator receiver protein n=2 Tax=Mycolicibacterium gilvum TaxID=1804 RepID=A0A378SLI1_9MYCO|nr:response regulator receiver protein [Mycolicibacterium gilvum]
MVSDSARTAAVARPGGDWWSREIELVDHLRSLRETAARELCGSVTLPAVEWDVPWRAAETISALTHLCIDALRRVPGSEDDRGERLCGLILDLQRLAMDWYLHDTAMRGQRLADCAAGLSRLRGVPDSAALLDNACQELVLRCGFHRAVLSKVENRSWTPLMLHDRSAPAGGSWFSDWINQTVPLVGDAPEAEMLSRRRPSLVYDTDNAPVYRPLIVQAGQSRSYVVAPLVLGQDVVGFLHTDHHPLARRVDQADRDVAWAFADGISHLYERAVLVERLQTHRDSVRELFFGAVDRIDQLCESGRDATRWSETARTEDAGGPVGNVPVGLTERESDVFDLMVTGASNQEIADRLVITEGTVKSHVKHILRKYGAVNRAQAIAWALNGS